MGRVPSGHQWSWIPATLYPMFLFSRFLLFAKASTILYHHPFPRLISHSPPNLTYLLLCSVRVKFFNHTFLTMRPNNLSCLFPDSEYMCSWMIKGGKLLDVSNISSEWYFNFCRWKQILTVQGGVFLLKFVIYHYQPLNMYVSVKREILITSFRKTIRLIYFVLIQLFNKIILKSTDSNSKTFTE